MSSPDDYKIVDKGNGSCTTNEHTTLSFARQFSGGDANSCVQKCLDFDNCVATMAKHTNENTCDLYIKDAQNKIDSTKVYNQNTLLLSEGDKPDIIVGSRHKWAKDRKFKCYVKKLKTDSTNTDINYNIVGNGDCKQDDDLQSYTKSINEIDSFDQCMKKCDENEHCDAISAKTNGAEITCKLYMNSNYNNDSISGFTVSGSNDSKITLNKPITSTNINSTNRKCYVKNSVIRRIDKAAADKAAAEKAVADKAAATEKAAADKAAATSVNQQINQAQLVQNAVRLSNQQRQARVKQYETRGSEIIDRIINNPSLENKKLDTIERNVKPYLDSEIKANIKIKSDICSNESNFNKEKAKATQPQSSVRPSIDNRNNLNELVNILESSMKKNTDNTEYTSDVKSLINIINNQVCPIGYLYNPHLNKCDEATSSETTYQNLCKPK